MRYTLWGVEMNFDQIIQYGFLGVSGVLGWFMREIWSAVQDLKKDLSILREKLPQEYVQKNDYKVDLGRVYELLDRIYDKLNNKVERGEGH